ncbi:divergent polysaccharide deacetylase family protein [Orbus sturtevantii]|uniref:divergent polysaccharide deacetylase family protein n=1 Tax=Orbus sturtevantii TaxID=3074109 RepID=UPI00370D2BAB
MKRKIILCKMVCLFLYFMASEVYAAKLALVIDDFGYRERNEEQVILLSPQITVAVLPNAPNRTNIATFAHQNGNDVMIHLPMAPLSKQPLEINTLTPSMSEDEIHYIVSQAVKNVPYAIGINNHMGSLMTSDAVGMENVMKSLSHYSLFFLDSKTIATSKAIIAAKKYRVSTVVRDVFLDDLQNEAAIAHQFDLAIKHAQKYGSAVAIGHPYNATVRVLKEKLAQLPVDIELVKVSTLVQTPEKINLSQLVEQYKISLEQSLFEYIILKKAN